MLRKIIFLVITSFVMVVGISRASDNQQNIMTTDSFAPPAQQKNVVKPPVIIPNPPNINAKAYVLMDANSGRIIVQHNMDQKLPPASLTKMMTLYLISQALQNGTINLQDQVLISKAAWKISGSRMFVKAGSRVPVKDLLQGIIVASGNDACVAMAEFVAGSQEVFVNMMNAQAQALGMNNTHFVDCTGLPDVNHYTTAHDLAILARALIRSFPEYYPWYKQKWFTYNGIRQPNRNRLLWRYPYADGVKTGHTNEAGFCLVSSALNDGVRLIAVVLHAPTDEARANDSVKLLTYGFRFYKTYTIYQPESVVTKLRVWFGSSKKLPVGVKDGFYVTAPVGQLRNAKVTLDVKQDLEAPIKKGQVVGNVVVMDQGQPIEAAPLTALIDITKGGFWRRTSDHIAHAFHSWFGSSKPKPLDVPISGNQ